MNTVAMFGLLAGGLIFAGATLHPSGYYCTRLSHMEWSVVLLRSWRFDCSCWRKFLQQRTDLPAVD